MVMSFFEIARAHRSGAAIAPVEAVVSRSVRHGGLSVLLCLLAVATPGCGSGEDARKTGRVSGKVHLHDQPMSNVSLLFEDSSRGLGASAVVNNGTYEFETPLVVGDYAVTVQPMSLPPTELASSQKGADAQSVPVKYKTAAESDLKASVKEGENKFDFQLKR